MKRENLEQPRSEPKKIVPIGEGSNLEIHYDPQTNEIIEAIRRDDEGQIVEYTNLREIRRLEDKINRLKVLGLEHPEEYVDLI